MLEERANEERNSYLELRNAKIARNHARLQELGLIPSGQRVAPKIAIVHTCVKRAKSNATETVEPKRRSLRMKKLVSLVGRNYESPSEPVPVKQQIQLKEFESKTIPKKKSSCAKNSAREMDLVVDRLLFGSSYGSGVTGILGTQLQTTGKAFVIEESARRAVDKEFTNPISFNKYCGAQEWGNAIYLWINFGFPGSEVLNTFYSRGRQVNWYGGSKMHDGTPLIQRLKNMGIGPAQQHLKGSDQAVVLWCRRYNATKKGFDPYVCFGRLSVSFLFPIYN